MCSLCNKGYMFTEIRHNIFSDWLRKTNNLNSYTCSFENILKAGLYYHKELRKQPNPYTVNIDYDEGTLVSQKQEYFVEMVASYSINDLKEYLLSKEIIDTIQWDNKRIIGLLKYFIGKYGIEMTLFMIDAANDNREDVSVKTPLDKLDNYYLNATRYFDNIKNNCNSNGGNTICPKKRF